MIPLPIVESMQPPSGVKLWRSAAHLDQDPDYVDRAREELLPGASDAPSDHSRRRFVQLLGATAALGGLAACRRPVEQVMPFADRPEELIPGVPVKYATAMPLRGIVRPLVVRSYDGRPVKVEGNAQHPDGTGATGVFEQASLLGLYDPDRSTRILRSGAPADWEDFLSLCQRLQTGTRRIAVLAAPSSSPTLGRLRDQLQDRLGNVTWVNYRSEGDDAESLGLQLAYGQPVRCVYDYAAAEVIVSLDADFLGPTACNGVQDTRAFAESRRLGAQADRLSRLYVAESAYSVTGSMADHRQRMPAREVSSLAEELAVALGIRDGEPPTALAQAMADDLRAAGSRGIVVAGESQPAEVHALVAVMNQALGTVGVTATILDTQHAPAPAQSLAFNALVNDMRAGNVDLLIMLGVNPAYDAPVALDFVGAMGRVSDTVHVGLHVDETAAHSNWHLPAAHYLEAWGDGRTWNGTVTPMQPLIAPLYEDARSDIEILGTLVSGEHVRGYDLVRETLQPMVGAEDFETSWRRILHDGYVPNSAFGPVTLAASFEGAIPVAGEGLELVIRLDPTVLDGSFANNAWCQELPDPMTKIVWDNVALMSPATARELGVTAKYSKGRYTVDTVTLTASGQSVDLPVWIMPGHADNSVTVTLGYGRSIPSGRPVRKTSFFDTDDQTDIYGQGALASGIGANVSVLRDALMRPALGGLSVTRTSRRYTIVTTQDHGLLDVEARPFVRMATLNEYRANPAFALESEAPTPGKDYKTGFEEYPMLWEERHPTRDPAYQDSDYWRNQWGMSIDLNACTGCNACIVACQAENNIQVVGKKEVGNGRELHWLRVDRYFLTGQGEAVDEDPQVVVQPMPCQHCENAPCESVCPVAATVHSPDGTNQMIYNRCIGTRYCANNCPYKVRRFNFFNWSKTIPETVQMAQNPNVSVRFRGVMEKCSFCVQRIRTAQKHAGLERRALHRDEVKTACQQACPAEAITFGDLNDPGSAVSQARRNPRSYTLLAELNVKPRVAYLARVRNPNPALESS